MPASVIEDFKNPETEPLKKLLSLISDQQKARGIDVSRISRRARIQYASECVLALHVEVSELASSWPFASWKTTPIDRKNIKRELVDCVFFLANIAACFDIGPDELVSSFNWVLSNNYIRIHNGVHKSRCPDCGTLDCGHSESITKSKPLGEGINRQNDEPEAA